ncbi:Asp23/Gls24 family envelope stress response protein [Weissella minor]|uniref:Stress response regulator gls24 homolog n=1 Tax=Weissella minor TaxID=1620 RepID=A0A0R2JPQ9_9LACO|nr:Asp23/Gls24 family envelope stress response protein [Weissella minor]KRN76860.1 hypothetical protein IV67_GL000369 [Weissella minor]MBS0950383.1 Asp23/Gls24 family envelope stress response protein [Weissella minor]
MANTEVKEATGKLSFDDKVIQKIVGISLNQIDGLLTVNGGFFSNMAKSIVNTDDVTAGINTEVGQKQVAIDMQIVVEYGKDIHALFKEMKQLVTKEVKSMTGLDVVEFNVDVIDIKSRAEYEADSESLQDKVSSSFKKSDDDTQEEATTQEVAKPKARVQ